MAASPSPLNYYFGKGNVYFTPTGGVERHLGNAPSFKCQPSREKLEHFSSMAGVKEKDDTVTISKSGTVSITLDEYTLENLQIGLFGGAIASNTAADRVFELFGEDEITGSLRFTGSNTKGAQFEVIVNKVNFDPSEIDFISDEYGQMELNGEMQTVSGSFGTVAETTEATA